MGAETEDMKVSKTIFRRNVGRESRNIKPDVQHYTANIDLLFDEFESTGKRYLSPC
jgi:hypothetical protein